MSDWLFVLLLVIVLAVVALVAVRLLRRRAQPPPPEQAPAADPFSTADVDSVRGDPRALAPGSIVEIRAQDYAVRGSLRMSEGSWTWQEHMLETADGVRTWLSVEEDPDLELVLYRDLPDA
ncbi:MAG: DUF4178 domain-containing protein, partial [Thermocrispum sp.]